MGPTWLLLAASMLAVVSPDACKESSPRTQSPDTGRLLLGAWVLPPNAEDANFLIQDQYGYAYRLEFCNESRLKIMVPGGLGEQGTYHIDVQQFPAAIDYVDSDGRLSKGILKIQHGKLWICWANGGLDRPAAFVAGPRTVIMGLQRAGK